MNINFRELGSGKTSDTVLNPRDIFRALPRKQTAKFQYPRDVQSQVWEKWFNRRNEKDIVVKMNTGSGKTVVGLLILKSSLNENKGPAVYIVPDNYLLKQVLDEARNLGIEAVENEKSPKYLSCKAILVITIYKLVNGLSVFGVGDSGVKIPIGSMVLDDVHACIDKIDDQFMLSITNNHPAYSKIYDCFKPSLHAQCQSKAMEIESGDPYPFMLVPFWVWQEKQSEITKILIDHKNTNDIKFTWPLIKESMKFSKCVVNANTIEITPHCIPIHMIPSIANANRRIFMSATLIDDSALSSHFGIVEDLIAQSIVPDTAGDVGDRMILLPQAMNPNFTDDVIKTYCKNISTRYNVVVIVPSEYRAKFWTEQADLILNKDNFSEGVEKLKKSLVGLVIMVNRYDGVDLPNDACRLLVIDGLPDVRHLIDKVDQCVLYDTDRLSRKIIQRIEQGMGRGIRSSDDYCVVFLMGKSLTSQIYVNNASSMFSPATAAQLKLSDKLSEQIKEPNIADLWEVMRYCFIQSPEWVSESKGILTSLAYNVTTSLDSLTIGLRRSYDCALKGDLQSAVRILNDLANSTSEAREKGYIKQFLAEYYNFTDQVEAQKILKSASNDNPKVLKPLAGISYHKLESKSMDQAIRCCRYITQNYSNPNKLIIEVNGLLDSLIFQPDTATKFQNALHKLAFLLGFESQQPEEDTGKGPDVFWLIGNGNYLVIECKNGAITDTINKHDCNQLNGSGEWFINKYGTTCNFTPVIIHLSNVFEYASSPKKNTRVINKDKLQLLSTRVLDFIKSISLENCFHDEQSIRERLIHHELQAEMFCDKFTEGYRCRTK